MSIYVCIICSHVLCGLFGNCMLIDMIIQMMHGIMHGLKCPYSTHYIYSMV